MADTLQFHSDDDIREARPGVSSSTGKLDQKLSTTVDIDTEAAFKRKCAFAGTNISEAMRDWVFLQVHGRTFSEMQAESAKVRRDAFFGTDAEMVQNRTTS